MSEFIRLHLPYRNTKCCSVTVGNIDLHFSYNTLIGIQGGGVAMRRANVWGPTTGRHIRSDLNIGHLPEVGEEEIEERARKAIYEMGLNATMAALDIPRPVQ